MFWGRFPFWHTCLSNGSRPSTGKLGLNVFSGKQWFSETFLVRYLRWCLGFSQDSSTDGLTQRNISADLGLQLGFDKNLPYCSSLTPIEFITCHWVYSARWTVLWICLYAWFVVWLYMIYMAFLSIRSLFLANTSCRIETRGAVPVSSGQPSRQSLLRRRPVVQQLKK